MCHLFLQMFSQLYRFWFTSSKQNVKSAGAVEMIDKISVMERKIVELEERNKELEKQLEDNRNKEAALQKVLCNYDNLLRKVIMERQNNASQKDETTLHLADLESAFYDLLLKYEKTKIVVHGFQQNEAVLKKQVKDYEEILDNIRLKFCTYKSFSDKALGGKYHFPTKQVNSFDHVKGKKRHFLTTI